MLKDNFIFVQKRDLYFVEGETMEFTYRNVETRKLRRIDRKTRKESVVTVSNRNGLPHEEHLRLLNLNDE